MDRLIVSGAEVAARPEAVGGKALSLARLAANGFVVPEFAVITSYAFALHLENNGIDLHGDPAATRRRIVEAGLPPGFEEAVRSAAAGLGPRMAVRSSGAAEDSQAASFAGRFASLLAVDPQQAGAAVKECWASFLSDRAATYRRQIGQPLTGPDFAVILQRQIFAEVAGVLYTVHPLEPGNAYLEANYGTGETVAGSLVTPDGYTISRTHGKVTAARIGSKQVTSRVSPDKEGSRIEPTPEARRAELSLNPDRAEEVYALGRGIEELAGCPQDIEWAFDAEGLWIVQARPVSGSAR